MIELHQIALLSCFLAGVGSGCLIGYGLSLAIFMAEAKRRGFARNNPETGEWEWMP